MIPGDLKSRAQQRKNRSEDGKEAKVSRREGNGEEKTQKKGREGRVRWKEMEGNTGKVRRKGREDKGG